VAAKAARRAQQHRQACRVRSVVTRTRLARSSASSAARSKVRPLARIVRRSWIRARNSATSAGRKF